MSKASRENEASRKYRGCGDVGLLQARCENFIQRTAGVDYRLPTISILFDVIQAGLAAGTITQEDANSFISRACPTARITIENLR